MNRTKQIESQTAKLMLDWYDENRRDLPWRSAPGKISDPYSVWLSEIMLQQTTVATVKDYFAKFLELWPTVEDLAAAPQDDVLTAWAGLGYYARARNLHKCAKIIANELNGSFPTTQQDLIKLPGIGDYTSAAIASIAFKEPATVVDGNIERVMSRLFACDAELPKGRPVIHKLAAGCTPTQRPGDYAQSLMDLGATLCTPKNPKCLLCPLQKLCLGQDLAETLPRKAPKKEKPTREGICYWIETHTGSVLLEKRPEKGLLGGMTGFPGTTWIDKGSDQQPLNNNAPFSHLSYSALGETVRHTFTHFHLDLSVHHATIAPDQIPNQIEDQMFWVDRNQLSEHALPTVMKKVQRLAFKHLDGKNAPSEKS